MRATRRGLARRRAPLPFLRDPMAVDISRSHHMDKATSRRVVEKIAASLRESFHFDNTWHGDRLSFERIGVNGYIDIADHQVRVYVRRSFLLPVSEAWIRKQVEAALDEHIINGEA